MVGRLAELVEHGDPKATGFRFRIAPMRPTTAFTAAEASIIHGSKRQRKRHRKRQGQDRDKTGRRSQIAAQLNLH